MKLSEIKGEEALDVLCELIEPISEITSDKKLVEQLRAARKNENSVMTLVKPIIQNHKKSVIKMLAILDRVPEDEYEINLLTLPAKLLEVLNDPEITNLFTSQGQRKAVESSGSALEKLE